MLQKSRRSVLSFAGNGFSEHATLEDAYRHPWTVRALVATIVVKFDKPSGGLGDSSPRADWDFKVKPAAVMPKAKSFAALEVGCFSFNWFKRYPIHRFDSFEKFLAAAKRDFKPRAGGRVEVEFDYVVSHVTKDPDGIVVHIWNGTEAKRVKRATLAEAMSALRDGEIPGVDHMFDIDFKVRCLINEQAQAKADKRYWTFLVPTAAGWVDAISKKIPLLCEQ